MCNDNIEEPWIFLCGEGTTDFGSPNSRYGALAEIVFALIQNFTDEEQYRWHCCRIRRAELLPPSSPTVDRNRRRGALMSFPPAEYAALFDKCKLFGEKCVNDNVIGVFHSDVDYTSRSSARRTYELIKETLENAIKDARAISYCCCVIPMPRTEAWLIKLAPENNLSATAIEELPGNDNAPNSPKKLLSNWDYHTGNHGENRDFVSIVERHFDVNSLLQLSSFKNFYNALYVVCQHSYV